jgi:anti-sigma regulatory factor (Ser/Thr protein kinase)
MAPTPHSSFDVVEASQVGQARRAATLLAEEAGFDAVAVGRIGLVATELGSNLVRYAQAGRLLVNLVVADGVRMMEIVSVDSGPGLRDVAACLVDGYSTGGTPGTGLGAVKRLSDEFDAFSVLAKGTVVLSRVAAAADRSARPAAPFQAGAIALPARGESVCGDAWAMSDDGTRAALLVADGLGHGEGAREASAAAVVEFLGAPLAEPTRTLEAVHQRLRSTRGAAVALAILSRASDSLAFAGIGNIVGRLLSGVEDRTLLSQHGTAGVQVRTVRQVDYAWPEHALLVMHSDGLTSRWNFDDAPGILRSHPVLIAAWLVRDHRRGADDVTVVVLKRSAP